jgi:hypothetical protein
MKVGQLNCERVEFVGARYEAPTPVSGLEDTPKNVQA